jgi:hypothetical protein
MRFIQKSLAKATPHTDAPADDKVMAKATPALLEFLTLNQVEGKARKTATLTVFTDSGLWKCFLNDRESGKQLAASADTFSGLLTALEGRITSDDPEWREAPSWTQQKATRKRS